MRVPSGRSMRRSCGARQTSAISRQTTTRPNQRRQVYLDEASHGVSRFVERPQRPEPADLPVSAECWLGDVRAGWVYGSGQRAGLADSDAAIPVPAAGTGSAANTAIAGWLESLRRRDVARTVPWRHEPVCGESRLRPGL